MTIVITAILVLGCVAALAQWWHQRRHPEEKEVPQVNPFEMECCGQHEVCEKESLLAAISRDIIYYNDEELDRFRGRTTYSEEETEEFREVLYTMRSDEVAGWVRSLQLRQINIPDEIKDEVFLIVGERRQ
ncbi:MAG: phospholipase [Bacteroidaceae bacterium]|nr:phospholipase [Bacteroidaceae bacterium]